MVTDEGDICRWTEGGREGGREGVKRYARNILDTRPAENMT